MNKNFEEGPDGESTPPSVKKMKFGPASSGPAGPRPQGVDKEKTARMPAGGLDDDVMTTTESLDAGTVEAAKSYETRGQAATPGETEELFVILPEEESGQLPVVETMVVEEQPWETGPSATEVLRDVPEDISAEDTSTAPALEDVPLMKMNPLSEGGPAVSAERTSEMGISRDDEIKVIEEIADIAADLDSAEPPPEPEAEPEEAPRRRAPAVSRSETFGEAPRRGRKGIIVLVSSIAALLIAGVFFYSDLEKILRRNGGEGSSKVAQAKGIGPGPGPAPTEAGPREELRGRIRLAMRLGLSGEAGKE